MQNMFWIDTNKAFWHHVFAQWQNIWISMQMNQRLEYAIPITWRAVPYVGDTIELVPIR